MRYSKHTTRRGVLLLVILALLAMFGMVAVTFVVVASQSRIAAESHQRLDEVKDPFQVEDSLRAALMQVLRGSRNPGSAIGPHSLLEDVYGNNWVAGTAAGFQFFEGDKDSQHHLIALTADSTHLPNPADRMRRVGCVLTMIDGAAAGASTRIVGYDRTLDQFRLLPFPGQTLDVSDPSNPYPNVLMNGEVVQGEYIISGRPFSGTGFGWNAATSTIEKDPALRPGKVTAQAATGDTCVGANEDYDAPDYQNMILGAQIFDGNGNVLEVIPSLHRPELAQYWGDSIPYDEYILRPTKDLHLNFTGGNINSSLLLGFDPINGPWDVDNDGDGIPDSVWVDLGFPARSSPDGRLYKPLFAILCVDLDGRLNVNAHGLLAHVGADPWGTVGNYDDAPTSSTDQQFASAASVLRGQGYGPAEIDLRKLFDSDPTAWASRLLLGDGTANWPGRYGTNHRPGETGADWLAEQRWFNYDYANGFFGSTNHVYGTPPDMQGAVAVGLDLAGRPIWDQNFCGQQGADNPYEMDPKARALRGTAAGDDAGFATVELERVFRYFDPDAAALPRRLLDLGGMSGAAPTIAMRRHEITTDSIDVPVPGGGVDPVTNEPVGGFLDLLQARVTENSTKYSALSDGSGGLDLAAVEGFFGPDLAAGRKMNLDRPLPERDLAVRQEFARHLFCLAMLLLGEDSAGSPYVFPWPTADADVSGNERFLTTHRIAQWAVNVVDFLDADSVMTPFQFEVDPFATPPGNWRTGVPATTTNLVWGMERPHLQLSETLAFHDRRVVDKAWAAGGTTPENYRRQDAKVPEPTTGPEPADETLDQARIPQGSLFVELYCTAEPGPKPSDDLFESYGGGWALKLTKRAYVVGANGAKTETPFPVWRLAITESARKTPEKNDLVQRLNAFPATFSLQAPPFPKLASEPQVASLIDGSGRPNIAIERVVSFSPAAMAGAVYYNRNAHHGLEPDVYLAPGEYAIVGPRPVTAVGSTDEWPPKPSTQQIRLDTVGVTANVLGGRAYPGAGQIKPPKTLIAAARWSGNEDHPIGVSVSEPLPGDYYEVPTVTHGGVKEWYGDPTKANEPFRDEPFDSRSGNPLHDDNMLETDTYLGYKYVLLQRLADPGRVYNPTNNPYITVDWMPIDLTVFNGEEKRPEPWPPAWSKDDEGNVIDFPWDPDDPNPEGANSRLRFRTRQRGLPGPYNLWAPEFSDLTSTSPGGSLPTPTPLFTHPLDHSLGFLNPAFGNEWNESNPPPGLTTTGHVGDPLQPFPWLTWNNRPPVNPYELMMVPATTAARFGWEFTMSPNNGPTAPYSAGGDTDGKHVYDHDQVGFVHLMNFFHSGTGMSELHRIFEFLDVPSRFVGAQLYVPNLTEPNHMQPTYREPGKVNLNTIFSERVFRGLMNGFREGEPALWNDFMLSRRGHAVVGHPLRLDTADSPMPTRFARPFRSVGAHALRPLDAAPTLGADREIESTLLRSNPDPTRAHTPLFAFDSDEPVNDTDRNPYFRYQGLIRLSNLVTTRSNVYAVWITVGFFEVNSAGELSHELETAAGAPRRHRAFYIIDRSIPVGFVRGEDLNVANAVLLQRFIE